ncbi:hypothetical protein [Tamaricihabitans halophyticus]|nr:hypothetical protein [Tamaricihabitans halophyticus]
MDRDDETMVDRAVDALKRGGVRISPGLSEDELDSVEGRFGFRFAPDHRALLSAILPLGDSWVDWREDPEEELRRRLAWPAEGVLFDVEHAGFWPESWGPRPAGLDAALRIATERFAEVPKLVPVFSHRYLPGNTDRRGVPVFSVYQTDVIYYGTHLLDYVHREFGGGQRDTGTAREYVPFWSDLATGADNEDL